MEQRTVRIAVVVRDGEAKQILAEGGILVRVEVVDVDQEFESTTEAFCEGLRVAATYPREVWSA